MVEQPKPALIEECDRGLFRELERFVFQGYGGPGLDGECIEVIARHRIAAETAFAEREAKKDAEVDRWHNAYLIAHEQALENGQAVTDLRAQVAELVGLVSEFRDYANSGLGFNYPLGSIQKIRAILAKHRSAS